jgi:endonuclease/exonuclease/phosphatase family metal-dependent hydrolase
LAREPDSMRHNRRIGTFHTVGGIMRIAAFNVQNLFYRAKALNGQTWTQGRTILAAYAQLNDLLQADPYTAEDKDRIIDLLGRLGLLRGDESRFVRLRRIRGTLLRRRRTGEVTVVAGGRSSWIGWVELITEHVDQLAMEHTAMVIRDVAADVLGVIEAESRQLLQMFTAAMLTKVGGRPYDQVMLIDGNDPRGIDVGLLARSAFPIDSVRSHIFDTDAKGVVFSRDCCEYHLRTPSGDPLIVLVTHLKSKGYGSKNDPLGADRRRRQAGRMADIYRALIEDGARYVALIGDFNDDPTSESLAPLLAGTSARDISEHPGFDPGPRSGTFRGGNDRNKIDYVLLSPPLYERATGGGVFRRGVYHGSRTRDAWPMYSTLTADVHAASDHAAIYADVDLR